MIQLSAAIITLNEEKNIARCITSLLPVVDEILVVDSFSTDKTKEICESFGVRFIENPFAGHIEQKNFALAQVSHPYILALDADEALDELAQKEVLSFKANPTASGLSFNRLNHYSNFPIRHCGWYPDRKLRLVKRDVASWQGFNPHDMLKFHGNQKSIQAMGNILHYSYQSISDHVAQTNRFTTIAAHAAYREGRRSGPWQIVSRPLWKFFHDYFIKRGFLDGRYGFIICSINALYALLKYAKIRELQQGREI